MKQRGTRGGVWSRLALGLVVFVLALGAAEAVQGASAVAIEGLDRSRSLPPNGAQILPYANSGYRLWREGDEVRVEVDASPLESKSAFELPEQNRDKEMGDMARMARGLTAGSRTRYEAISRILGWVASSIDYQLDREQSQEAEAVLARGSAYCTGVARLTVALLGEVGIEAREVAGYVLGGALPGEGAGDQGSGYHRWIEAYLPDRGWVFSDPLSSHHFVPATYIRLASEELIGQVPAEGLLLERAERLSSVDLYPAAVPGIRARRNHPRQLAAALRVEVDGEARGLAVLVGEGVRRTHTLTSGVATFVGLEPGSYRLRLLFPGRPALERVVELPDRIRRVYHLPAAALGALGHSAPGSEDAEKPSLRRKL